jgi:hypothetical protein
MNGPLEGVGVAIIEAVRFGESNDALVCVPASFGSDYGTLLESASNAFEYCLSFKPTVEEFPWQKLGGCKFKVFNAHSRSPR